MTSSSASAVPRDQEAWIAALIAALIAPRDRCPYSRADGICSSQVQILREQPVQGCDYLLRSPPHNPRVPTTLGRGQRMLSALASGEDSIRGLKCLDKNTRMSSIISFVTVCFTFG